MDPALPAALRVAINLRLEGQAREGLARRAGALRGGGRDLGGREREANLPPADQLQIDLRRQLAVQQRAMLGAG